MKMVRLICLISHNLAVVGYLADKIAVMYLGQLFEVGAGADLFQPPFHPYTGGTGVGNSRSGSTA